MVPNLYVFYVWELATSTFSRGYGVIYVGYVVLQMFWLSKNSFNLIWFTVVTHMSDVDLGEGASLHIAVTS